MFYFQDLIDRLGFDASKARLVRHDRRASFEWIKGRDLFEHYITYQSAGLDPFAKAELAFQFLPGPTLENSRVSALFVGAYKIEDQWLYGHGERRSLLHSENSTYQHLADAKAYELSRLEKFEPYIGKVLIDWGTIARSWSQRANRQTKEIVELRRSMGEPAFPGFAALNVSLEDLATMPASWRAAVSAVKGVYLLVCPETGQQYVGSAYGFGGFMERWSAYAADGHGGNILLKSRIRSNYRISVLEIASPEMSASDIIHREAAWKEKLGSRAYGLNAN